MNESGKDIRLMRGSLADSVGTQRFMVAMNAKLRLKRAEGRGGWNRPEECSVESLCVLLADHVKKGDMIDIANIAMMIWNREHPEALP